MDKPINFFVTKELEESVLNEIKLNNKEIIKHTLEVANLAGLIAAQMGGDTVLARRAGILHDIGKALTHDMPGSHC